MININLEITEKDIKKYLKDNKENYRYYEPLFIKYLKDNKDKLPREIISIMISELAKVNDNDELCDFNLETVHNLDLSGICHILIPATRYYDYDRQMISIVGLNDPLKIIANEFQIPLENQIDVINEAVDNYRICGKVEIVFDDFLKFKMSREYARNELSLYQEYYDKDKVKLIRKIVKEGVK